MKTILLSGMMALAAARLFALPPVDGAQWWSTNPNLDCSGIHALIYEVPLPSGEKGFACGITGSFIWLAAGGKWTTSIRVAAPDSGAIGVQYVFFNGDGTPLSLDTIADSAPASGNTASAALHANQPYEIQLLGASSDAPQYNTTQTGSVFGLFFCADTATCASVLPQLLYSFLPVKPWSLSVPIAWDTSFSSAQPSGISTRWSTAGISDATHTISLAIYNQSPAPASYTVRVYDRSGSLAGQAATPVFSGTRGFLLRDVVGTALPAGILKITVEGNSLSTALFLQFNGDSATSLQAASDRTAGSNGASTP